MMLRQLRDRGITDPRVLEAFAATPREKFVPPQLLELAYDDRPLSIGYGQTISQPYVVALMLQELGVKPGERVLDVGAGSGYQAALLSRLGGEVVAVERIAELARQASSVLAELGRENVWVVVADGTTGYPPKAPYDRIICGAGGPDVPKTWTEQLADNGRIVMPVGSSDVQTLVAVDKSGQNLRRRELCQVRFVKLIGKEGWPAV